MKNTKWNVEDKYNLSKLFPNLNMDADVLNILYNRGFKTEKEIKEFLNPEIKNMQNPYDLQDVKKAVQIIKKAIETDKNIWIYGDYDVDGITSTSLLYLALKGLGANNVNYYIPLRNEGYGLNKEAIKKIKSDNADLLITVDCGITSFEEIEYANELQLPVIITDHHGILNDRIPNAFCVINPKRKDNLYKFSDLAGVGTIFMLLLALYNEYGRLEEMYDYFDIVSIGTVADIVPLVKENRIIVHKGLKQMLNTKNKGLRYLLNELFNKKSIKTEYTTYDVGFIISPLFNASGRLKDAKIAVKLLISDNLREIEAIVKELIHQNIERKEIQEDIIQKVEKNIIDKNLKEDIVIVDASNDYYHGVIGIVASKIVDIYYKPAVIIELKENEGIGIASCRSIDNFDILEALQTMPELFVKFGGHKGAAGFTIKMEYISIFKKKINDYARKKITKDDLKKVINIDQEIQMYKNSYNFLYSIEKLKPFGFGNPQPLFMTKKVMFDNVRLIGDKKNHLMFDFIKNGYKSRNSVWFNAGDIINEVNKNLFYDVVYKLKLEEYNGHLNVKSYIEDIKVSEIENDEINFFNSLKDIRFPQKELIFTKKEFDPNRPITIKEFFGQILLYQGRTCIGNLGDNLSNLLQDLNKFYNWEFIVKCTNTYEVDNGVWLMLQISRKRSFVCRDKNETVIFKKIKEYLLGKLNYNSITKRLLAEVFKNKKNIIVNLNVKKKKNESNKILLRDELHDFLITLIIYKWLKKNTKNNVNINNKPKIEKINIGMINALESDVLHNITKELKIFNSELLSFYVNYLSYPSEIKEISNLNNDEEVDVILLFDFSDRDIAKDIEKIKKMNKQFVVIIIQEDFHVDNNYLKKLEDKNTLFINNVFELYENFKVFNNLTNEIVNNIMDEEKQKQNIVYFQGLPNEKKLQIQNRLMKKANDETVIIADNNIIEIL